MIHDIPTDSRIPLSNLAALLTDDWLSSTAIAIVVSALVSTGVTLLLHWSHQRTRRLAVERAIGAEIRSILNRAHNAGIDAFLATATPPHPPRIFIRSENVAAVYDKLASEIGRLEPEIAFFVVRWYTRYADMRNRITHMIENADAGRPRDADLARSCVDLLEKLRRDGDALTRRLLPEDLVATIPIREENPKSHPYRTNRADQTG